MAGDNEAGLRLVVENGQGFVGALNDAHAAQTRFVDGLGQTAAKSGGFGQIITGALRQIGSIAVDAFMEAGKAAIGFVTDSIKVAGDFEAGMGRFAAVTGDSLADSGLSLKDFRDQFLQLGKDTQYSAAEAEEAAINLAKGGIDPLTISATALKGTMDLAAAGELDLGVASEITAKQLGVWKDAGLDGVTMANLLAQAANASTVDVEDLAMGLANSGGTAKTAGVDYKDLVTTMALIAPNFSSATDAGTSLKTFFSRMIPTTKAQTAAMVDLGLATVDGKSAFFDAKGQFIGMESAAKMLQGATKNLTKEQKLNYLQTIFGNDAIRAAAAIAEAGADGYDAMTESMDKAGTAAEQAAKRQIGFNFAQEQLKGSLETLQIILGTALLPLLTDFLNNVITPGINTVMNFAQGFFDASDKVGFLTDALNAVVPGAGGIITMLTNMAGQMQGLVNNIITAITTGDTGPLVTMLQGWGNMFLNWVTTDVLPFIGTKLGEITTAIQTWVTDNVPVIAGKLSAWGTTFLGWVQKDVIPFIGDRIAEISTAIGSWITTNAPIIAGEMSKWSDAFLDWVKTDVIPFIGAKVTEISTAVSNWVSTQAPVVGNRLSEWGKKFLTWVDTDVIPFLTPKLDSIWTSISTWVSAQTAAIGEQVSAWGKAFTDWISNDVLPNLPGKLAEIWTKLYEWVQSTVSNITLHHTELAEAVTSWISEKAIPWLQTEFPKFALVLVGLILALPAALIVTLAVVALAIVNGIVDGITRYIQGKISELVQGGASIIAGLAQGMNQTKGQVDQVFTRLGTDMTTLWNGIKTTITGIWEGIKIAVQLAVQWVRDRVNEITQGLSNDVTQLWNTIKTTIDTALTNIQTAVSDAFDTVKESVVNSIQAAIDGIGALLGEFYNKGKAIIENIVNGIIAVGGKIKDTVMGFVNDAVSSAISAINGAIAGIRSTIDGLWGAINSIRSAVNGIHLPTVGANFLSSSSVKGLASAQQMNAASVYNTSYNKSFNLTVNSLLPVNNLRSQFVIMESLA